MYATKVEYLRLYNPITISNLYNGSKLISCVHPPTFKKKVEYLRVDNRVAHDSRPLVAYNGYNFNPNPPRHISTMQY